MKRSGPVTGGGWVGGVPNMHAPTVCARIAFAPFVYALTLRVPIALARVVLGIAACVVTIGAAYAHSASDAYLTLTRDVAAAPGKIILHGQWDIALRDLDFVLKLDDDGDGHVTWGEVRRHEAAIERYAYRTLSLGGPGNACVVKPVRQMIDDHADGAYAALFFDAECARAPRKLTLRYTLFFGIDPSHRGIFVMHSGDNVATALFSPENTLIDLSL